MNHIANAPNTGEKRDIIPNAQKQSDHPDDDDTDPPVNVDTEKKTPGNDSGIIR